FLQFQPEYYKDAPHFRRVGDGPEYRLEIPSAKLDFTGTYSVIATNCHGEVKAVISLQIYAKDILRQKMEKGSIRHGNVETLPHFIRHLRNLRCCDGDSITLECHVEGLPEPYIIWEKDGRVLPSDKEFSMSYDGIKATLSIPRVYPEDEGEFTCVAKNNLGRTLSSACIIVDVPEEKENMLNRQLSRPTGLLSASSTPISTPRSTPNRSFSPMRLSYRNSSIDIGSSEQRRYTAQQQTISAPKFLAIPHSRVVEEGDSVRFQCAIAGHPTPWSTWDKDGMIVIPTTRISVKEIDDLRFLEIDEVTFDDAGLYRITLENDYGRIEATARLDVICSRRYSKSPSSRSVRASSSRRNAYIRRRIMGPSTAIGGRMALAAGFRGSSVPACKFYHNDSELLESNRVHIEVFSNEAVLFIDNCTYDDSGTYTCIIEGDHEPITTTVDIIIHDQKLIKSFLPKEPRITKHLPEETQSVERETIDLSFEFDCSLPYSYVWTRNGDVINDSDDFNYIDHGNGILCLRIHDAFDLDSGIYACKITTIDGYSCCTSGQLTVFESVADDTPILLKTPLPAIAYLGSKASFCAKIHSSGKQRLPVEANWYVCGRKVTVADSPELTFESSAANGLHVLHINNAKHTQSGEVQFSVSYPGKPTHIRTYTSLVVLPTAAATNDSSTVEHIESTILPNVELEPTDFPPYILLGPEDCTALIGGSVKLSISFESRPKAQIKWFKAISTG
ncbi:myosin light chain kinase, smooth muscle-like, partial [Teleopsis dalmanni]|uniref:myosin light chain kinase, smooth muscle-like n=1 Tax=Teleopsis dalmanni TaxID=139649 RepID=UPI0018CCC6B6